MKLFDIYEPGQTPMPHSDSSEIVLGIDLGTTNSLIAISNNSKVEVISDEFGSKILPSVISFNNNGDIDDDGEIKISSIKRLIGKNIDEVKGFNKYYNLVTCYGNNPGIKIGEKTYTPVEISAEILKKLKIRAEKALNKQVSKVVITVPAYFDDAQRIATKDAALLAGLDVIRLINEPTAAAIAYGLDKKTEGNYLVYDLGGGTFDVSLLKMENNIFHVIATGGDSNLGGDDFDESLMHEILEKQPDLSANEAKKIARLLKEELTDEGFVKYKDYTCTLEHFENINKHLIDKTIKIMHKVILDSKLNPKNIDGIILVGGSTKMPVIKKNLQQNFNIAVFDNLNPDLIVAEGAAIQAEGIIKGSTHLLIDVNPLSIGIEMMGGIVEKIIPRNSSIPASFMHEFTTYQDGQTGVIFHIVQGERELAKDNRSLASFELKNIPPMKAGIPRIKVKFVVDADGLLTVSAWEETTNIRQTVHIKSSYGLPDDVIRQMLYDSLANAESDVNNKHLIETKVEAEGMLKQVESILKNIKNSLEPEFINDIEVAISDLKEVLNQNNRDLIENKLKDFEKYVERIAEKHLEISFSNKLKGMKLTDLEK